MNAAANPSPTAACNWHSQLQGSLKGMRWIHGNSIHHREKSRDFPNNRRRRSGASKAPSDAPCTPGLSLLLPCCAHVASAVPELPQAGGQSLPLANSEHGAGCCTAMPQAPGNTWSRSQTRLLGQNHLLIASTLLAWLAMQAESLWGSYQCPLPRPKPTVP